MIPDNVIRAIAPDSPSGVEPLRAYLANGGDANAQTLPSRRSLLHLAAEHRNLDAIGLLVHHGAKLNLADDEGWTPLHLAVDSDIDQAIQVGSEPNLATTRLLIQFGASESAKDKGGRTPRDVAVMYGPRAEQLYDEVSGDLLSREGRA